MVVKGVFPPKLLLPLSQPIPETNLPCVAFAYRAILCVTCITRTVAYQQFSDMELREQSTSTLTERKKAHSDPLQLGLLFDWFERFFTNGVPICVMTRIFRGQITRKIREFFIKIRVMTQIGTPLDQKIGLS